jgi:hypothetical protein
MTLKGDWKVVAFEAANETAIVNKLSQTYMDRPWKLLTYSQGWYWIHIGHGIIRGYGSFRFPQSHGPSRKLLWSTFGVLSVSLSCLLFDFPNLSFIRCLQNQAERKSKAEEAEGKNLMLASKWDSEQLPYLG